MQRLNFWDWLSLVLIIVGGLNWLLVGILKFDLVVWIFGDMTAWTRAIYIIVGLAAVYSIYLSTKLQKA